MGLFLGIAGTYVMYQFIVCCTSWHLQIVLSIVYLIISICVVYGEWVDLAIVSVWHLVL